MRRKKFTFKELSNMIGFHAFYPFVYKGIKGYVYHLERIPTKEEQEYIFQFKNVHPMTAASRYAPEQKTPCLFIGDKCFSLA